MAGRLNDVLHNSISTVESVLQSKLSKVEEEIRAKVEVTSPKVAVRQKAKELKLKEIEKLETEIEKIDTQISNTDPTLDKDDGLELYQSLGGDMEVRDTSYELYSRSRNKKWFYKLKALLSKTIEYKNIMSWKKIKNQIQNQFDLCIKDKEKQEVILRFQMQVDWKALGVDLPNLFDIKKITVAPNGLIVINNALPDLSK